MAEVKGLRADVLKHKGGDCSNGGLSSRVDEVTIVGLIPDGESAARPMPEDAQVFEPSETAPPVVLVAKTFSFGGPYVSARPAEPGEGVGPMMGGCYIASSDSRFSSTVAVLTGDKTIGAVPLHDRYESAAQYASYD